MIRRYGNGWGFDFRPDGVKGSRIRKRGFSTRLQAANALRALQSGKSPGLRLSALIADWHRLHGQTLKDAKYRLSRTMAICERLGDPLVEDFRPADWADYRLQRLNDVTPSTVNHEQRYLSAVFGEGVRLGLVQSNPLAVVRSMKVPEVELTYLTLAECSALLDECRVSSNPSCYAVALLCLATGGRWGEVQSLHRSSVLSGKVIFQGATTKTAKTRAVPVDPAIIEEAVSLARSDSQRLFYPCRDAFRSAYKRTGLVTPQQLTHVLRHTFASHFVMSGGDILTLQRILGHSSIAMTMRYAHLSPNHLSAAVNLNPLALLSGQEVGNMWATNKKGPTTCDVSP